jgi:DNA-binding MarR family transcriptional regulator
MLTVKRLDRMLPGMPPTGTPDPAARTADDIPIPALLRAARGAYGQAIQRRLAADGFDDLPRNAPFVLGGMVNQGIAASDLLPQLGVTKQAASQLVDTLVTRGYLERRVDYDDRRRVILEVTERGRSAAAAVRDGVVWVDDELARRLSPADLKAMRAGLVALIDVREELEESQILGS